MALFHHWTRTTQTRGPGQPPLSTAPFFLGSVTAPFSTTDTFMRGLYWPTFNVAVGAPGTGTPGENWWDSTDVTFLAWVNDGGGTSVPASITNDTRIVALSRLYPTLVASPSAPNEYYVTFTPHSTPVQTHGQRKGTGTGNPTMCIGMMIGDPTASLVGYPFTNVTVRISVLYAAMWGSTHP